MKTVKPECRAVGTADAQLECVEHRQGPADGTPAPKIQGYAAKFNSTSETLILPADHPIYPGRRFTERVRPGAFAETLRGSDIRALVDHDPSKILGRNLAGTLTLTEDETGLYCEIEPPPTSYARDVIVSIQRGDVSGMSFRFYSLADQWSEAADGSLVRELIAVRIDDVSVVTYPAYHDTEVAVRSLDSHLSTLQPPSPKPAYFPVRNAARLALVDL